MSFNIYYDGNTKKHKKHLWNNRKDHIVEIINENNPDVVGIQEGKPN